MNSIDDSDVADIRVICGPTGAGKSALALALAQREQASIISADSRQVYRGFDIGTAKPGAGDRALVPHAGIDLADPDDRFTAADWAERVPAWCHEIDASRRTPLVVGGTGFYLRALIAPLFQEPDLDEDRRSLIRGYLDTLSAEEVRHWCERLDPARAHLGRAQWERAIEVALLTGYRISDLHASRPRASALTARYLVVDPGPDLADRLSQRLDAMLTAGWLDEVRGLAEVVPSSARAWTATGYELLRQVVLGTRSLSDARNEIEIRTRQYAKRQRTWFRHQLAPERVTRLDPRTPDAIERATQWFYGEES